ncbi:PREDICTED: WD repeat-containing protein 27 [Lipotes vexillifer]|uniref:WD repeat-containing protein 27 n=1 Tax=Lipotes vexillifer TaxID=118797 RepID=A0A340WEJ6_LIPVE|nr:PREDICTED: WD repeat-containing protein 27 [Lipotes vexillifer]
MEEPQEIFSMNDGHAGDIVVEKYLVDSKKSTSHVQLACSGQSCAFPLDGNELCVWDTKEPPHQTLPVFHVFPEELFNVFNTLKEPKPNQSSCHSAHDPGIEGYALSVSHEVILDVTLMTQLPPGRLPQGTILGTLLGKVLCLRPSPADHVAAVCAGNKVFTLDVELRPDTA